MMLMMIDSEPLPSHLKYVASVKNNVCQFACVLRRASEHKLFKEIDIQTASVPKSLNRRCRRAAVSLPLPRQRPMVLMQLIHEPAVRRSGRPPRAHELKRLRGVQAMRGNEVPTHDSDGARRAHRAVHEHARIGAPAQRPRDVPRRAGEVRRELRKRRVVQRDLHCVRGECRWERDAPRHCGYNVRDAERGERSGVLGGLQVRDVDAREDLGDVWGGGRGRRRGGRGDVCRIGVGLCCCCCCLWEWEGLGLRVRGMCVSV